MENIKYSTDVPSSSAIQEISAHAPREKDRDPDFFEIQRGKCFKLCEGILWKGTIHKESFICKEIGRPLSNHVYKCYYKENRKRKVLVRIYGEIAKEKGFPKFHVKNLLTFNILAERKLGPKCHGYNEEGRVEELYKGVNLQRINLQCPVATDLIVKKLAEIHAQDMPLTKEPTFLSDFCNPWQNEDTQLMQKIASSTNFESLQEDLRKTIAAIEDLNPKPKVVFSHNGLTEGDIMYLTESEEEDIQTKMKIIDFEYCAYNYRGYDLSMLFIECGIEYQNVQHQPYYTFKQDECPPKKRKKQILRAYLRACLKTTSDPGQDKDYDIDTAVDQLFNETETCALAVHLMWAVWGFTQCINKENIAFGYLTYAVDHLEAFQEKAKAIHQ